MEACTDAQSGLEVCRTCLSSCENMESIFDSKQIDTPLSISDMLMSFCSIEMAVGDGRTEQICPECSLETLRAYSFKLKCEKSDEVLRRHARNLEPADKKEPKSPIGFLIDLKQENVDVKSEDESFSVDIYDTCIKDEDGISDNDEDYVPSSDRLSEFGGGRRELRVKKVKKERKKVKKKKKKKGNHYDSTTVTTKGMYKAIFECPKCHGLFKTFHMICKHLVKVHQTVVRSEEQLGRLVDGLKKSSSKTEPIKADGKEPSAVVAAVVKGGDGTMGSERPAKYKCACCDFTCRSFDVIKSHIVGHRGEKYIQCDECEYRCSGMTLLVRHKRVHTGERRFPCPDCPYRTTSSFQLRNHAAAVHSAETPFACHFCPYTAKLKLTLQHHIQRKHENRRPHECPHCPKRFYAGKDLKMHLRTHTGEKPHVCEHCAMAFSQKSNLMKHVLVMHSGAAERAHACPQCAYRGRTPADLRSHQRRHSGARPHTCPVCQASVTTKSTLKLHMRRHAGDARYACSQCPYRCYEMESLKAHRRVHTGERPYACDVCNYRARTNMRLKNHKLSHSNPLKYACQHCPYRANYRSNLIKHLEKNCGAGKRKYTRNPGTRYAAAEKLRSGHLLKVESQVMENEDYNN